MTPFLLFFALLLLLAIATWWKEFDPLFVLGCLAWLLFVGLRSPEVGADTKAYVDFFLKPGAGYGGEVRALEPGYLVWNTVLGLTGLGSVFFLMATGAASLAGGFWFVWKNSDYKSMALLLFAMIPEILRQPLGTLRQAMAISLFLIGFHLFQRKDVASRTRGFLLFVLAATFHTSILVVIGLTLAATALRLPAAGLWAILLGSAAMGLTDKLDLRSLFGAVSGKLGFLGLDRLSGYSEFRADDWSVGTKARAFMMIPGLVMAGTCLVEYTRRKVPPLLVQVSVLGMAMFHLTLAYPMAGRASAVFFMLLVVALTRHVGGKGVRPVVVYSLLVLYYLRLSFYAFQLDLEGLTEIMIAPYKLNPDMWL